jgi:hypothetical protein
MKKPMIGNPIPDEYKVMDSEVHNLSSFREMYEQRLAQLEQKHNALESRVKTAPIDNTQVNHNGFLITRDLVYTTYKITDLNGKDVPGLSEGSFKSFTRAQTQVDNYIALQKALNKLNGHKTTENNITSA